MASRALAWSVLAATALLAAACNGPLTPAAMPRRAPKIVFAESTHDFGRVEQGTPVVQAFTFRNAGGFDLTIDNLRAACGCTAAVAAARVVAPGAEGRIEVTLDTARESGAVLRTISVYSNDPSQPVTTLTLRGAVHADLAAAPPELYVGHVQRGRDAVNEVRVLAAAGVTLGGVDSDGRVVQASLREPTPGTAGDRVHIAIRPDAPLGRFHESVSVRASNGGRRVLRVSIVGIVDDVAGASPGEGKGDDAAPPESH